MRASGSIVPGRISKRFGICTLKPKRASAYSWKSCGGRGGVTSRSGVMRCLRGRRAAAPTPPPTLVAAR